MASAFATPESCPVASATDPWFADAVAVSGLVLSKLDSSAKGGVAFAVTRELGLPIQYIGTGERLGDLLPFDPASYAAGLLGRMG